LSHALTGLQTLILNADFRPVSYYPLSICTWQEAIKALLMGRVDVISEYEVQVRSPSTSMNVPSVVALKRYIPGAHRTPPMTRHNILLRDKYTCQYCGDIFPPRQLTLDHVMPRASGGEASWENLVAACRDCNSRKGDKIPGKGFHQPHNMPPHLPSCRELQKNAKIVSTYNFHESWEDYIF